LPLDCPIIDENHVDVVTDHLLLVKR